MTGAEVVLLNFHSDQPCRLGIRGAVELPSSRLLASPLDLAQVTSTGAYVITREACRRLAETALPVQVHPDGWAFFYDAGAIDNLRCVTPMPVANSVSFRTTIDCFAPRSARTRLAESLERHRVPLFYQLIAFRRRGSYQRLGWTGLTELVDEAGPYNRDQCLCGASPAPRVVSSRI